MTLDDIFSLLDYDQFVQVVYAYSDVDTITLQGVVLDGTVRHCEPELRLMYEQALDRGEPIELVVTHARTYIRNDGMIAIRIWVIKI